MPPETVPWAADVGREDDPFEEFNRAMGAGRIEDPYPDFAELRRNGGVMKADIRRLMGLDDDAAIDESDMPDVFTVGSYEGLCAVLRDGRTFSSSGYAEVMGPVLGHTILEMDEPEHHAYRNVLKQVFSRKAMTHWETEIVAPVINAYIDEFIGDGRADLVRQLTLPFPMTVIADLLGLPREDLTRFHRLGIELIGVGINWERGLAASQKLRDYFAAILEERRRAPADDIISVGQWAILAGLVGARLYEVVFNWDYYGRFPAKILAVWEGGLAMHGGLIVGPLVGVVLARRWKIPVLRGLDVAAPSIVIGQAIGRWGNFFNEEAFGAPTDLPWKLYISPPHRPPGFSQFDFFHPTFLYESLWDLAVFVVLVLWLRRRLHRQPGGLFFAYVGLYSVGRFIIESVRLDSFWLGPFRVAQLASVLGVAVAIAGLAWTRKRAAARDRAERGDDVGVTKSGVPAP